MQAALTPCSTWRCVDTGASVSDSKNARPSGRVFIHARLFLDRYSEIMSQVKTLADEMEASFICGTTPMSEWDSYQQKLKDAGIEEAIQMMQEAYDTYMAN